MVNENLLKDSRMSGVIHVEGVCSQSGVKTKAVGDVCIEHKVEKDDVYYINRSTPPQEPSRKDPQYQEKSEKYKQDLETWKARLPEELAEEKRILSEVRAKQFAGKEVAAIYCLNTNDVTVGAQGLDEQPTAVKTKRESQTQISKFQPQAPIDPRLVVGFEYAGARTAAFEEITKQLKKHAVPLGMNVENIFAIESIGEVDINDKAAVRSLLEATTPLRDIACMAIKNTQTAATVKGSTDALELPEEVTKMVFEGKGELTIGKACSMLFYRDDNGTLVPVVDPKNHQDPHKDMAPPGHDRQATITKGLNSLAQGETMGAIAQSVNKRDGEIIVSLNNLPLSQEYLARLEKHREQTKAGLLGTPEQMLNEYLLQQAVDVIVEQKSVANASSGISDILKEAESIAAQTKKILKQSGIGEDMQPLVEQIPGQNHLTLTATGQNLTRHAKAQHLR